MKQRQSPIQEKKTTSVVATRGRVFQGHVIKVFPTRIVVEFERTVYVPKYERYTKTKTRLHARLPAGVPVAVGDQVQVRECRPLSKIIHFVMTDVIRKVNP